MGDTTNIPWADRTFSPWIGCMRVSPGCGLGKIVGGCYAEALAKRYGWDVWGPEKPRRVTTPQYWRKPYRWNEEARVTGKTSRVFCASLCDVCEDREDLVVPQQELRKTIEATRHLLWMLLTKRPENIAKVFARWEERGWPPNVWMGTTTEDQKWLEKRMPHLMACKAKTRFISHEPALGDIDLSEWIKPVRVCQHCRDEEPGIGSDECPKCGGDMIALWGREQFDHWVDGTRYSVPGRLEAEDGPPLHWVITGGESGGQPREYRTNWARSVRDQCREAGVPVFIKQMGANPVEYDDDGRLVRRLKLVDARHGEDMDEWDSDLRVREFPSQEEEYRCA